MQLSLQERSLSVHRSPDSSESNGAPHSWGRIGLQALQIDEAIAAGVFVKAGTVGAFGASRSIWFSPDE